MGKWNIFAKNLFFFVWDFYSISQSKPFFLKSSSEISDWNLINLRHLQQYLNHSRCIFVNISSAIRQKGESQNWCYKKTKHANFSEKQTFLSAWYAYVCVRIRRWKIFVFLKIWHALFSCNIRFEIHPFVLLPTIYC